MGNLGINNAIIQTPFNPPPSLCDSKRFMFKKLALIGCGLIGGSFALALKKAKMVDHVIGFSSTQATLTRAKAGGVIDEMSTNLGQAVVGADLVLLAIPVRSIGQCFRDIRDFIEPGALLMDVGSTKHDIENDAVAFLGDKLSQFVPSHPIAGKEKSGVDNASAELFLNRPLILTPLSQTQPKLVETARLIWTTLGSRVHLMSSRDHDNAFAAVSHLPHLIAFAFMNGLMGQPNFEQLLSVAGPGFRDFSRIAASDPTVWKDIFFSNKENLKKQVHLFSSSLQTLEQLIDNEDSDALIKIIELSRSTRSSWQID